LCDRYGLHLDAIAIQKFLMFIIFYAADRIKMSES
jgi:hypothetical protein